MTHTCLALACLCGLAAAQAPDAKTTASGLKYEVLEEGRADGRTPKEWDRARCHYTGWFAKDGKKFDSSRDKGKPFDFPVGVGAVIKGWDEGIRLMKEGARYKFYIPWKLAYGAAGGRGIPPQADLVFEVELIEVQPGHKPEFFAPRDGKSKTTESGLKYEVTKDGEGNHPKDPQGVRVRFVLWNTAGKVLLATQLSGMHIAGPMKNLRIPQLPPSITPKFWREAVSLLRKGGVGRFEVPPNLCWGAQQLSVLPPNSVTIWELEVLNVVDPPPFVKKPREELQRTSSGLLYEVVKQGTGKQATAQSIVKVHYTGWTLDGRIFDSSQLRDEPVLFRLSGVITGWREGVQLMKEGAIYRFTIPADLAYGERPKRPGAPAGTLIFLIELIEVK